jgi:hypothetical protein
MRSMVITRSTSEASDFEDVALGEATVADESSCGGGHADEAAGFRLAEGFRLGAGIDHAAGAVLVEMSQFAHGIAFLRLVQLADPPVQYRCRISCWEL